MSASEASLSRETTAPRILVVDDSLAVRMQVRASLVRSGYVVVEAKDGVEAMEAIVREPPRFFSAMVCDVNMPRMGGIELLAELARDRSGRGIPTLMLTTDGEPGAVQTAKELGAVGWFLKPFKAETLIDAIGRITAAAGGR